MHIHLFALLVFFQSFTACQQDQERTRPLAASIGALSVVDSLRNPETAANIVFQSVDGGQSWQDVSAGLPNNVSTEGVFISGGEVFLGTGNGLYRSSSTARAPVWQKEFLLEGRINDVFPGRAGLYATSYAHGLFQNLAGTGMWHAVSTSLPDKSVRTVLESKDGSIFLGTDSGIFKSADGGKTWKQVFAGGIVLDLVAAGNVLIGGSFLGVLRSTDGGEHWAEVLNETILAKKTGLLGDRFVTILGTKDPSQVNPEGVTQRLRVSADGGQTWQRMEQPLLPLQGAYDMDASLLQVRDIHDIVQLGEILFCSFDTGIYRSLDQGKTWLLVYPSDGKSRFTLGVSGKVVYAVQGGGC